MTATLPNTTGGRLFRRVCRVTLIDPRGNFFPDSTNALEITGMRVKFEIERSVKADPNTCKLEIFNLAQTSRRFCELKPLTVWIDAGYDDNPKQLFTGDSHFGYSHLEKPEWVTKIQLRDGGNALDNARANATYGAGITVSKILNDMASRMGLTVDAGQARILAPLLRQAIPGARVYQGAVKDQLTELLRPLGIQWSIQNSRLELLRDVDTTGLTFLIAQETGMIGSPEWSTPKSDAKPNQIRVKCLLQPEIVAGSPIQIGSKDVPQSLFRVQKVTHRGDTHGEEWVTEIEAVPPGTVTSSDPIRWKATPSGQVGSPGVD